MTSQRIEQHDSAEYVDIDVEVGIRIQSLMFRQRQRQEDLGLVLGISASAVSKKLRGINGFSIADLYKIGRAYNVDPAKLLPELDSNQQPSDYLHRLVKEGDGITAAEASRWDGLFDFYAAGWIAEEKDPAFRWRAWLCPGAGGVLGGMVATPSSKTWAGWFNYVTDSAQA